MVSVDRNEVMDALQASLAPPARKEKRAGGCARGKRDQRLQTDGDASKISHHANWDVYDVIDLVVGCE